MRSYKSYRLCEERAVRRVTWQSCPSPSLRGVSRQANDVAISKEFNLYEIASLRSQRQRYIYMRFFASL